MRCLHFCTVAFYSSVKTCSKVTSGLKAPPDCPGESPSALPSPAVPRRMPRWPWVTPICTFPLCELLEGSDHETIPLCTPPPNVRPGHGKHLLHERSSPLWQGAPKKPHACTVTPTAARSARGKGEEAGAAPAAPAQLSGVERCLPSSSFLTAQKSLKKSKS